MSLEWLDYEDEDEDTGWNLYAVTMTSIITDEALAPTWPVYAEDFNAAIKVYQVLLYLNEEMQ